MFPKFRNLNDCDSLSIADNDFGGIIVIVIKFIKLDRILLIIQKVRRLITYVCFFLK